MKLHILGTTSDDKGTQLEILAKEMFAKQGYSNISGNVVSSGGSEFDAIASRKIPLGAGNVEYQVICECKALDRPINITDWMKFIGKVYVEKLKHEHTIGLMITLSGANGNVIGSFNDIKEKRLVTLMAGDDVIEFLSEAYSLPSAQDIEKYVKNFTDKGIAAIDLAYYEKSIYWIVGFITGNFTILKKDASLLKGNEREAILDLLNKNTEYADFIDIEQENEAYQRRVGIDKVVLSILMDSLTALSIDEIFTRNENLPTTKPREKATKEEIEDALKNNCFVAEAEGKYCLKEFDIDGLIVFLMYVFSGVLPIKLLGKAWFEAQINDSLLDKILDIQHKIKVSEEQRKESLFLLKHSPTALAYAINPDKSVTNFRSPDGATIAKNVDTGHTQMFMQNLVDAFVMDFHNQLLYNLYFDDYKICDVKMDQTLTITLEDKSIVSIENNRHMLLCRLSEEYGGQIVLLSKLPEV